MKKKILLSLLAAGLGLFSVQAQKTEPLMIKAGEFKEISLADDMNVVLVQAGDADSTVTIDKAASNKLRVYLYGSSLHIEPQKRLPRQTTVYVVVKELSKLEIGPNTVVHTNGILQAKQINVYLDNQAKAYLRTTGKVKAYAAGTDEVTMTEKVVDLVARKE